MRGIIFDTQAAVAFFQFHPQPPLHLDQPLDAALTDRAPLKEDLRERRIADQLVATEQEAKNALADDLEPEAGPEETEELEDWKVLKKSAALGVLRSKLKKLEGRLVRSRYPSPVPCAHEQVT